MGAPINIKFDIEDTIDEFSLNAEQANQIIKAAVKAVTMEMHRNWIAAAERELKSTRNGYVRGLLVADDGMFANTITLVGVLNNMVENGVSAFDMKNGFMKSAKVKFNKKGGWYLTIPLRQATPDAIGESEVFAGIMPIEVYNLVKGKAPTITSETNKTIKTGESLSAKEIPTQFQAPKTRASVTNEIINKTFDAYTHKSSIYAGLNKTQKLYENANQSTYNSFRRVGANSDPMAFIHSGIKQHNLSQQAIENTDVSLIVDNTVDKMLSEFGFGT